MRYQLSLLAFLLAFLASPGLAQNKMMFELSAMHFNLSESRAATAGDGSTYTRKTKTAHTYYGLGFCYVTSIWCFGAKYLAAERKSDYSASNTQTKLRGTLEMSGYGLTIGYQGGAALAHFTYLIEAEKRLGDTDALDFGGSTSTKYPAKLAYSLDLGYGFDFRGLRIGPLLRITHFEYDKIIVGSQTYSLERTEADDFIIPHFALWVDF
ncbi:MAG: hypothetical protein ACOH5I_18415 [Oligoflexus sp.]